MSITVVVNDEEIEAEVETQPQKTEQEKLKETHPLSEKEALLDAVKRLQAENQQLNEKMHNVLEKLYDKQEQEKIEYPEKAEITNIKQYFQKSNLRLDDDDPAVLMLVYMRRVINDSLLDESQRLKDFLVEFDKRMVNAKAFIDAVEKNQNLFLNDITRESQNQRNITALSLEKLLKESFPRETKKQDNKLILGGIAVTLLFSFITLVKLWV